MIDTLLAAGLFLAGCFFLAASLWLLVGMAHGQAKADYFGE